MTSIKTIYEAMRTYNQSIAYGSECNAYQDFVADCYKRLGVTPWDQSVFTTVPDDFADYWQEVADGTSLNYDADTGNRNDA